jgi:hypothetical protein
MGDVTLHVWRGRCHRAALVRFASWMTVTSLGLCAFGASWTLWRRPGVFPPTDALFWATTGTVMLAWAAVAGAALGAVLRRPVLVSTFGLTPGVLLVTGGLTGRLVFPAAEAFFFAGPFTLGALWLFTTLRAARTLDRRDRLLALGLACLGSPLGVVQATARLPEPAGTTPSLTALPEEDPNRPELPSLVSLDADGSLSMPCGSARLSLAPVLRFDDASLDGFWPLRRTPVVEKLVEAPRLTGAQRRAHVRVTAVDGGVELEAATAVSREVAAHLSRFADVSFEGVRAPTLRFDATKDLTVPASTYDYPSGRPLHFAAWTGAELVVWRATSAEKGPFVELGRGPLTRGAPLGFTVLDGATPLCHLSFLDFTAQASTQRSPTAGEGVPVNAVQFGRYRDDGAPVGVILSLAATGIGSGFETTRHAEGVYRNRVHITAVTP